MYKIAGNEHPICDNCRCDDIRLIEINHKNGDGARDTRSKYHQKFLYDIITGRRKTDDLDLRCRVCNALHYIESKYGKLPFKVHMNLNNTYRCILYHAYGNQSHKESIINHCDISLNTIWEELLVMKENVTSVEGQTQRRLLKLEY
jgi:hypothetical protein